MRPDPIELPHPPQATDEESRKGITRAWRSNSTGGRGWAGCSTPDCFNRPGANTRGDSLRHSASTPESGRRRSSLRLRPVESNSISTRTPGRSWEGSLARRFVPPRHAPARLHGGGEARAGRPSPPIGRSETSHSGKRTRTSRGVYGLSIGGMRATAPLPPVWPTAWRASKGSSDATCRYGRIGLRSIAVRALAHWPVARWTAWSESWRGGGLPIRGKPP